MSTISFHRDLIDLIASGRKTQTRRPYVMRVKPGDLMAIRGTGIVLRVTRVWQHDLHDMSHADALAEGCESVADFFELWDRFYGRDARKRSAANPFVTAIEFEVTDEVAR